MSDDVVIEPRRRSVQSWATGRHVPRPMLRGGVWLCADCGGRLSRYRSTAYGETRLRHNPRDRR